MNVKRSAARFSIDRWTLLGATALGLAMCSPGVGKVALSGQWLSPAGIGGGALGVAALGIVAARLLGKRLPCVESDRAATVALVAIVAVKYAIAAVLLRGA